MKVITTDPIVEEVRTRGRALTQRLNNNPREIFQALYRLGQTHPQKLVTTVPPPELNHETQQVWLPQVAKGNYDRTLADFRKIVALSNNK